MSTMPLQWSLQGLPLYFIAAGAGLTLGTSASHTAPSTGVVHVLHGIDISVGNSGFEWTAWYEMSDGHQLHFGSGLLDPTHPTLYGYAAWRGERAIFPGTTLTIGADALLVADIALAAWGIAIPAPYGT